jgi:hypothetical protein
MAWNAAATMAMVKTHPAPASQAASQISSSARAKNSASQRGVAAPNLTAVDMRPISRSSSLSWWA